MPLEVLDCGHLEVHVHLDRYIFGGPRRRCGVLLLLNGQDAVAVAIEENQPVCIIGTSVGRWFLSLAIPEPQELAVELAQAPAVLRVDRRVQQDRIARHARLLDELGLHATCGRCTALGHEHSNSSMSSRPWVAPDQGPLVSSAARYSHSGPATGR